MAELGLKSKHPFSKIYTCPSPIKKFCYTKCPYQLMANLVLPISHHHLLPSPRGSQLPRWPLMSLTIWYSQPWIGPSHTVPGLGSGTNKRQRSDGMPLARLGAKWLYGFHHGCFPDLCWITQSMGSQLFGWEPSSAGAHAVRNWSFQLTDIKELRSLANSHIKEISSRSSIIVKRSEDCRPQLCIQWNLMKDPKTEPPS